MDHTEYTENTALRGMVGDFISSYAQRDTTVSFSSWLSERLCQELPDLTPPLDTVENKYFFSQSTFWKSS